MQMRTASLSTFTVFSSRFKPWSHIELGAANYGNNPYADPSYSGSGTLGNNQFDLLFATIDQLIKTKGNQGIFYINDRHDIAVNFTVEHLTTYLTENHPNNKIRLIALPGDFFSIELPMVDSIHLKNPETWFFRALDNEIYQTRMQYFAEHAKEGLTLVTYFKHYFLPRVERLGIGFKVVNDNYCAYVHADGMAITKYGNNVEFNVKSIQTLIQEKCTKEYITHTRIPVDAESKSVAAIEIPRKRLHCNPLKWNLFGKTMVGVKGFQNVKSDKSKSLTLSP